MSGQRSFLRDVTENSGLLGAASVVVRLSGIGLLVAIVRRGGTAVAGAYGIAVLVGSLGGFAFSLGLGTYCTRTFAAAEMTGDEVRAIHGMRAIAMLAATAVLLAATPILPATWRVGFIMTAASVFVDQWNETGWVICRGLGRTLIEARADVVTNLALLVVALVSLVMSHGMGFALAGALLLGTALARSVVAVGLVRSFPAPAWSRLKPLALRHLRRALPYCASDMLGLAYLRGDTLVLAAFASSSIVGTYVAANSLVGPVVQVAAMMGVASLALMARYRSAGDHNQLEADETRVQHRALVGLFGGVGCAVTAAFMVGLWIATPLLFPSDVGAIRLLGIVLALFLPLRFANFALSAILLAGGGAGRRLLIVAGSTVVNVALNLAMDGRLAAFGAAWGTVLTEVVVTVLLLRAVDGSRAWLPVTITGGPVLAACLWTAVAIHHHQPPSLVVVPTAVLLMIGAAACCAFALLTLRTSAPRAAVMAGDLAGDMA